MRRADRGRSRVEPAGPYEVRFRLERSYRPWGVGFFFIGLAGFILGIVTSHLLMGFLTGSACGAGLWLYVKDPREYYVVLPRRRRLQVLRTFGKKTRMRGDYDLDEYVRLETAQYLNRPKGLRCMVLLARLDGNLQKVDDRLHDEDLVTLCAEVAQAAELEFVDRGRIDLDPADRPRRAGGEAEDVVVEATP